MGYHSWMDDNRICVFMPAYNEESSVVEVIERVSQFLPGARVVVINDGSFDKTVERAEQAGARVIDLPFNLGIGGAVQAGLKYAWRNGFEVAIEIDADGQHDPSYARKLVEALDEADMVIGSRFVADTDYRSSTLRRFGIHLFSWLIQQATGKRVYDTTSGYRAYNRKAMRFLSYYYPADFPEPESIVMLLLKGFKIKEVPVEMSKRLAGESVVGKSDFSFKGAYFLVSNAIAILLMSVKARVYYGKS